MEPYPDPEPNSGERNNYYDSIPQTQQHIDGDGGSLNTLGHAIAPALRSGMSNPQDLRAHPQNIPLYPQQPGPDANLHLRQQMQDDRDAMDQSGHGYNHPDSSMPPRKRSKASRACDECRKKKVKCDSTEERENAQDACSNCTRSGVGCQFSRIPQKRGPSKGWVYALSPEELEERLRECDRYIKELSERVRKLESTPAQNGMLDGSMVAGAEYSPVNIGELVQRKRTFGESESGGEFVGHMYPEVAPAPSRALAPSPYAPSPAQFPPSPHSQFIHQSPPQLSRPESSDLQNFRGPGIVNQNGVFQSQQNIGRPMWTATSPSRTASSDLVLQPTTASNLSAMMNPSARQALINRYYNMGIHLPILPIKIHTMLSILGECPAHLVDAFYEALQAAVRSLSSPDPSKYEGSPNPKALQLLISPALPNDAANRRAKMVQLQTMILMAIEALLRASNPLNSANRTVSTSVWLTNAVNLAYEMKLHMTKPVPAEPEDYDEDLEEHVERRLWWSLCTLERWHSHGNGSPSIIPEHSLSYYREDKVTLGVPLYWLARLTVIIGHINYDNTSTADLLPKRNQVPRRELDFWRLDVPDTFGEAQGILRLCFWHLTLLDFLSIPSLTPVEVQEATDHLVNTFLHEKIEPSPLTIGIKVLMVLALIEFLRHKETEEVAKRDLKALREGGHIPSGWENAIRKKIDTNISQAKAHEGLQKLAEAAHGKAVANRAADGDENIAGGENALPDNTKSQPQHHFEDLLALTKRGHLYAFRDDFA